ncbi:MAG: glycerate kinase [Beijerinckiaceae bacterium]
MREFLESLFRAAISAADPAFVLPGHLPPPPKGRTLVVGAGKAAASMAQALERNWNGPLEGLVITRYGHAAPCERIEVVEAAHPVPDAAGLAAARRILDMVADLGADDLVICLISGGGSALLTLPAPGLTLADKQAVNTALLRSGAPIGEMNVVRKHLSAIKGGRLAVAAAPARIVTLIISDVPSDDPSVVASGPTVGDGSTLEEARAILEKYGIEVSAGVAAALDRPHAETPKPGDPRLGRSEINIVASAGHALRAAAVAARERGFAVLDLGDRIEGEARLVAREHAALVQEILAGRKDIRPPCVVLSGGETTVTMKGGGKGGRNSEYLLALAIALDGKPDVWALAGDTDGIDGSEDNAGAFIGPDTLERASAKGFNLVHVLEKNDAFTVFEALGDLVYTGPTLTNVNDFRAIFINLQ